MMIHHRKHCRGSVRCRLSSREGSRWPHSSHTLDPLQKRQESDFLTLWVSLWTCRGCLLVGCKQKVLDESPRSREGENGIVATPPEREKSPPPPERKYRKSREEEIGFRSSRWNRKEMRSSSKSEKSTGIGFRFHFRPVRKLGVEQARGGVTPIHWAWKIGTCSTTSSTPSSSSSIVIIWALGPCWTTPWNWSYL